MGWTASISSDPPLSGEVAEHSFSSPTADGCVWTWVCFRPATGPSWYGSFAAGVVGANVALCSSHLDIALVSARGVAYVVDLRSQSLICLVPYTGITGDVEPHDTCFDAVAIPSTSSFAVIAGASFRIVGAAGLEFSIALNASHGGRFTSATSDSVSGVLRDSRNRSARQFTVDLRNRIVRWD